MTSARDHDQSTTAATPKSAAKERTPSDVLRATAALLEPAGRWGQGALARDEAGLPVSVTSSAAKCFCVNGAIARAADSWGVDYDRAQVPFAQAVGGLAWVWNDEPGRTQSDVVEKLLEVADQLDARAAIAKALRQDEVGAA